MREESGENMSSQPLPNSIRRGGLEQGFTLIELMVALALSAILSIMIMMVSTSAQETYTGTLQKVEVYNRFRLA
ncbi:MAG TPA: hypothetical protein DD471_12420, partial [Planctomycetes bacterium]|nr:hypothetical protein [Planctomycetota bacterium]